MTARLLRIAALAVLLPAPGHAQGGFPDKIPEGVKGPAARPLRGEGLKGPVPTNDWWSSLAWTTYSDRMYPHPLAVQAQRDGLRVWFPDQVTANKDGIFAAMPGGAEDLVIGHSAADNFPDARPSAHSDWFVTASFQSGAAGLTTTFGHGSPYVFAEVTGGKPLVRFARAPEVLAGAGGAALLLKTGPRHYGLFGPAGSVWSNSGGTAWTCATGGKGYITVAALPDGTDATFALFRRHAHARVTGSKVDWVYDQATASVTSTFRFSTAPREGSERATLFALYPHQWRDTDARFTNHVYPSVRGPLKLAAGTEFVTRHAVPPVLPALPVAASDEGIRTLLRAEAGKAELKVADTYWGGKALGRHATLAWMARSCGEVAADRAFTDAMRKRLESWLTAEPTAGKPGGDPDFFAYDPDWGTLIGYPASYGSETEINDHHFHYGYFLHAAAAVAAADPTWAATWRPRVNELVRDIAGTDPADPRYPRLRNLDPYAGHSWASGHAKFADGNNNESSSEAMNAWAGVLLWGVYGGQNATRDLGAWLLATELAGIEDYWFDVHGDLFPPAYTAGVVTMVWGGKGVNATWFSAAPEDIHSINWLPWTGTSPYLGRHPAYAARNLAALRAKTGGPPWKKGADHILMYQALTDAAGALAEYGRTRDTVKFDSGNSRANLENWLANFNRLGPVDAANTADSPLALAFAKGKIAWADLSRQNEKVTFRDGTVLLVPRRGVAVNSKE